MNTFPYPQSSNHQKSKLAISLSTNSSFQLKIYDNKIESDTHSINVLYRMNRRLISNRSKVDFDFVSPFGYEKEDCGIPATANDATQSFLPVLGSAVRRRWKFYVFTV